ncbi:uncharacterized protein LOC107633993 [Arachis ipaensis]|nr:uncharacterized protein LOC107633993 [Arachis ipaensis]
MNASRWFYLLSKFESRKASGTIDLSEHYIHMIKLQFQELELKFHVPQPDEPGYPASAYDPSSDVTEQFLLGYFTAHFMLQGICRAAPCLDLLSEVSPVKIKDGNLVANAAT